MAIASLADYRSALRERPLYVKTAARVGSPQQWLTLWDATGSPSAATLAVGNTTNGVVPTDATTGASTIVFGSGVGYLTEVEMLSTVRGRYVLYDRLFHAGAYAFNASTTLASQPSFSGRLVGGLYAGLQLWVECVTAFTGSLSVAVTYTNAAGTTARSTGTTAVGALVVGQMVQLPLQVGDIGLQKVESVTASVASAGTFNVVVLRPLWCARASLAGFSSALTVPVWHGPSYTGMPQVFGDSCLAAMYMPGNVLSSSVPIAAPLVEIAVEVASA